MNVSEALKLFSNGRLDANLGNGPISRIADKLVAAADKAETTRMEHAQRQTAGIPMFAALKNAVEQARENALMDNELPVISRYDFCQFLKGATDQLQGEQGIRHASLMARQMWHDDPMGTLSVGAVAKMRAHYGREYPSSKVARVIEASVLSTGFNTLPLPKLTRIANEIAASGLSATEIYSIYEGQSLSRQERTYINALLAMDPKKADIIENVSRRMAQEDIEINNEEPHIEDGVLHADEELAVIESPWTGEDLVIEVGQVVTEEEAETEEGFKQGSHKKQSIEENLGGIDNSEELADAIISELDEEDKLSFTSDDVYRAVDVIISGLPEDVFANEDKIAQIVLDKLGIEEEEEGMEFIGQLEDFVVLPDPTTDGEENIRITVERDDTDVDVDADLDEYETFAIMDDEEEEEPLETFPALDINAALQRMASFGVRGSVYRNNTGSSLYIDLGDENILRIARKKRPAFTMTAGQIEEEILSGETVRHGHWSLKINDDDEIELASKTAARTCKLAHLDTAIADFICMAAKKYNYKIATTVPGNDKAISINADKIAKAIQNVAPEASYSRNGTEMIITAHLDQAGLNRVRKVLDSRFGVSITAQALAPNLGAPTENDGATVNQGVVSGGDQQNSSGTLSLDQMPPPAGTTEEGVTDIGAQPTDEPVVAGIAEHTINPTDSKEFEPPPVCRTAQMDMDTEIEPPPLPPEDIDMDMGPAPDMDAPSPEAAPMEFGGLSGEESEAANAAFEHYRNQGRGPAQAIHDFVNDYADLLDKYGEGPERQAAEADLISIMSDAFAHPSITAAADTKFPEGDLPNPTKINQQPPTQTSAPSGKPSFKEKDKVSFGEKKPVARPNKPKNSGQLSDTGMTGDGDTKF